MFCKNCGTQIGVNEQFCSKCGTKVSPQPNVNPSNTYQPQSPIRKFISHASAEDIKRFSVMFIVLASLQGLLLILCFVPIVSASVLGLSAGYSFFDDSEIFTFILAALCGVSCFFSTLPFIKHTVGQVKTNTIFQIVPSCVILGFFLIEFFNLKSQTDRYGVNLEITFGGWLLILDVIASIVLSFIIMSNNKRVFSLAA